MTTATPRRCPHTPGPWTIPRNGIAGAPPFRIWTEGDAEIAIIDGEEIGALEMMFDVRDGNGVVVARMPWSMGEIFDGEYAQQEANAILIAAAPALLEAALHLIEACDEDPTGSIERDGIEAALAKARAAVADMQPDGRTVEDVQRNHVSHMRECAACTWSYCDHYSCDCDEPTPTEGHSD
jgi:hypothetical protein